jgi:isoquinoline 1-oxidoreductase beta subunit
MIESDGQFIKQRKFNKFHLENVIMDRRKFIQTSAAAGGGLFIGFHIGFKQGGWFLDQAAAEGTGAPNDIINTWVKIAKDNAVTVYACKWEMGQGVHTTMPALIADEAEFDWDKVKIEFAPARPPFIDVKFPPTAASKSIRGYGKQMRVIGASIREMMIAAAAKSWDVSEKSCEAKDSFVIHSKSGRKISYGELGDAVAKIPVPKEPKLKKDSEFKLIGKPFKRMDSLPKATGAPIFGIDVTVPGMVYAAKAEAPVFGGDVTNFDALAKKKIPGAQLVKIPNGLAVVSDSYWKAQKILNSLKIKYSDGPKPNISSESISQDLEAAINGPSGFKWDKGEYEKAKKSSSKVVDAVYEVPFLAHAALEPQNCTAHVTEGKCEVWAPTQNPLMASGKIGKILGIPPTAVTVHAMFMGGGFGRRIEVDYAIQAALISKAVGKPVKLIWSREEDITHDTYRAMARAHFSGGLDSQGKVVALWGKTAGDSIFARFDPGRLKDVMQGQDMFSVSGIKDFFYEVPNLSTSYAQVDTGIPAGFLRAPGKNQNCFFTESFIDELAHAAGKDPYEFRKSMLSHQPRLKGVLDKVASMSGWGKELPEGAKQGIAVDTSCETYVAQVAQVRIEHGRPKVEKVWCAVDCGMVMNPNIIEQQVQSAIIYGLSAAMTSEVTIKKGRVEQANFDTYVIPKISEVPVIEVAIIESKESPGGIGEPPLPPIMPAVTNAIFAATGVRVRTLPISRHNFDKT